MHKKVQITAGRAAVQVLAIAGIFLIFPFKSRGVKTITQNSVQIKSKFPLFENKVRANTEQALRWLGLKENFSKLKSSQNPNSNQVKPFKLYFSNPQSLIMYETTAERTVRIAKR